MKGQYLVKLFLCRSHNSTSLLVTKSSINSRVSWFKWMKRLIVSTMLSGSSPPDGKFRNLSYWTLENQQKQWKSSFCYLFLINVCNKDKEIGFSLLQRDTEVSRLMSIRTGSDMQASLVSLTFIFFSFLDWFSGISIISRKTDYIINSQEKISAFDKSWFNKANFLSLSTIDHTSFLSREHNHFLVDASKAANGLPTKYVILIVDHLI